jgi:hypothetical protein
MYLRVGVALLAAYLAPTIALSATHTNKTVSVVHSPDSRECIFFQLDGVAEADPASAANPWFAVPKTHNGYKEIVAALLLVRATGAPVQQVTTSGALACGHPAVANLSL